MKTITLLLVLLLVAFLVAATPAEMKLPSAGIVSGNIFYQGDLLLERLQLTFTFNDFAKAQKQEKFAEERLSEIEKLSKNKKDKTKAILKTQKRYEQMLEQARTRTEEIQNEEQRQIILDLLTAKQMQHTIVLNNLKLKVPTTAVSGIETAIENSQKYKEKVSALKQNIIVVS